MPELIPVIKKEDIGKTVASMARNISSDYADRDLTVIGVLNGAFIFLADLVRKLSIPVEIDFVRVASYGAGTESSGEIQLTKDVEIDIKDRDLLIVEDIIDTGLTLSYLIDHLKCLGPHSVKICTLIDKRERREVEIHADYAGHVTEEGYLVGYGLDHAEKYRNLPEIYHLKF
ncbi:MAG: hypoxanthine phosphoribosyltransferase [Deltaproteobacteria bacterium]|nr:hypoxanthine phosphoribosyltransferase [Deltaproteobacteria bacterium]